MTTQEVQLMEYVVTIAKGYGYTAHTFVFNDRMEAFDFAELAAGHGDGVNVKIEFGKEESDE